MLRMFTHGVVEIERWLQGNELAATITRVEPDVRDRVANDSSNRVGPAFG